MSSVPALPAPAWRLPALVRLPLGKRRRAALACAVLVAVAAVLLVATGAVRVPWASTDDQGVPTAELAAARARAVALAKAHARVSAPRTAAQPARAAPTRVADATRAADLFASHSWYVPPPPPPPAAPAPPAAPSAPPFPYTFVGSYAPDGDKPVFFLARADRVIDAHVGDHLDGVYEFESADGGQLVFNYLPLGVRQSLPGGVGR
jgi:hypothetical protein